MNNLSYDIEKLLKKLEVLCDYDVERLVIEHLQKSLNALDELQQSYHRHYLAIIQTLLQQLTLVSAGQQSAIHKRLVFLEKLLSQPSLGDLETLHQGISDLQHLITPKSALPPSDQIIGDLFPHQSTLLPCESTLETAVTDRIQAIQQNNDRFARAVQRLLQLIEDLGCGPGMAMIREDLQQQARQLLQGQQQLAQQLEEIKHQLNQAQTKNELLHEELQRARALSLTDELTTLPNRRAFLQRVEEEIGRVQRHPSPLSLAIIDLDHFKQINDHYGHAIGDEVLRAYAKHVLSTFRRHDHVARFGGEEFIILLPNTDTDGAIRALTKIRDQVARHTIHTEAGDIPLPSFSAGVTRYHSGESIDDFVEHADQALYQAKKAGRNRIETIETTN